VGLPQRREQRVRIEPRCLSLAEGVEGRPLVDSGRRLEPLESLPETRALEFTHCLVVDRVRIPGRVSKPPLLEPAPFDQVRQVDQ
jgi:hypothetical protein